MSDELKCICPKCGIETFPKSDIIYMVVTYNPTLPYSNEVLEYSCLSCKQVWFL